LKSLLYFYIMEVNEIFENTKFKAKSFAEAILPIIGQYLLAKEKLKQLKDKGIGIKEQFDCLNGILKFQEEFIINEMREL